MHYKLSLVVIIGAAIALLYFGLFRLGSPRNNSTELTTTSFVYEMKTPLEKFASGEKTNSEEVLTAAADLAKTQEEKKTAIKKEEPKKVAKKSEPDKKKKKKRTELAVVNEVLSIEENSPLQEESRRVAENTFVPTVAPAIEPRSEEKNSVENLSPIQKTKKSNAARASAQNLVPHLGKSGWLFLLQSSPTKNNTKLFLQAYHQRQVHDDDFFNISFELLESADSASNEVARYLLKENYSPIAFSYLAKAYKGAPESFQKELWAIMTSYSEQGRWLILLPAFSSQDSAVIIMASEVLKLALKSPLQRSQQNMNIFISALNRLSTHPDPEVSQSTSSLLNQIRLQSSRIATAME